MSLFNLPLNMLMLYAALLLGLCFGLFVLVRVISHRIRVEIIEPVKDGYVIKHKRFAIAYDRFNKMEYLRPIFGKDRMPAVPRDCFIKMTGLPLVGILRELYIIKQNPYSYQVLLPPDKGDQGSIVYKNSKDWVYLDEQRKFKKKQFRKQLIEGLVTYAPLAVIFGSFAFFAVMIIIQIKTTSDQTQAIKDMTALVEQYLGGAQ